MGKNGIHNIDLLNKKQTNAGLLPGLVECHLTEMKTNSTTLFMRTTIDFFVVKMIANSTNVLLILIIYFAKHGWYFIALK